MKSRDLVDESIVKNLVNQLICEFITQLFHQNTLKIK